jgi:hypothetical protein
MMKKIDKVDVPDVDKSEWIKLELSMVLDKSPSGSKYSQHFALFKDE